MLRSKQRKKNYEGRKLVLTCYALKKVRAANTDASSIVATFRSLLHTNGQCKVEFRPNTVKVTFPTTSTIMLF